MRLRFERGSLVRAGVASTERSSRIVTKETHDYSRSRCATNNERPERRGEERRGEEWSEVERRVFPFSRLPTLVASLFRFADRKGGFHSSRVMSNSIRLGTTDADVEPIFQSIDTFATVDRSFVDQFPHESNSLI
ncbi:uncharacterized protein LOC143150453 [Ptiloglossa arizonensis]|uniref:uncharacterized protein LOC143150453 n=1 Tax=Ptiloglossa arizonensis TaxID=3350558 RepID=UPI003FA11288